MEGSVKLQEDYQKETWAGIAFTFHIHAEATV